MNQITPERYFFMYAFPCLKFSKKFTKEEFEKLEKLLIEGKAPSRQEMEKLFTKAFERIKQFSGAKDPERYWTLQVMKDYWLHGHNDFIGKDPLYTDFCKVSLVEILEAVKTGGKYKVKIRYKDKEIKSESYVEVKPGDKAAMHRGMIIEKIEKGHTITP